MIQQQTEPLNKQARLDRAASALIAYFQTEHKLAHEQAVHAAAIAIGSMSFLEIPALKKSLEIAATIAKEEHV